jgi:hypothetical protein
MQKEEIINKNNSIIIHKFYCDKCGKFLGSSEEYDDGYYENKFTYEYQFFICNKWVVKKAILCDEHRQEFEGSLITTLKNFGFETN